MIFEKIKKVLVQQLDADPDLITRDTDFMNDLGADSLDLVELIMTLEEECGIDAIDDSIYEYRTVGEIADFLETILND